MIRQYDLEEQIPDEIIKKLIINAHKAPGAIIHPKKMMRQLFVFDTHDIKR
jgi:hypothetical protein